MNLSYHERLLRYYPWLVERYGEEVGIWLAAHFDRWECRDDGRVFEHMTNLRCYEINNKAEKAEFEKEEAEGCCGSYKETVRYSNGRTFVLGFNYGH